MKHTDPSMNGKPGISRRQAVSRLLQVVAGTAGLSSLAACPGGSTYGRTKLGEEHGADDSRQVGEVNQAGNLEVAIADVPENTVMELTVDGTKAYLYHGQVDGSAVWYATSRVCTHMKCLVAFSAEGQEYNCPCHRSKFAVDGTVLKRPAKHDLQVWDVMVKEETVEIIVG